MDKRIERTTRVFPPVVEEMDIIFEDVIIIEKQGNIEKVINE